MIIFCRAQNATQQADVKENIFCALKPSEKPTLVRAREGGLRQILNLQRVVIMPPLAAAQHLLGNFLHRQVGVGIGLGAKDGA
jgi:hypothetical protein